MGPISLVVRSPREVGHIVVVVVVSVVVSGVGGGKR